MATDWEALNYGVAKLEDVAGLDGLTTLQKSASGELPYMTISKQLTFRVVEVAEGFAAFEGETGDHILNPFGTVHGGWVMALIDSATGYAGHTTLPPNTGFTTIETKVNMSRPIFPNTGVVRCEAKVISAGRRIISCEAWARDKNEKLLAHGTSTLMVLPMPAA